MDHEQWRDRQDHVEITSGYHTFDVAYNEFGSGSQPTLFLHGIPTWSFLFRDVHGAADHALLPDLPGYGYTQCLGEGGYDRSIRAQEEYVLAFLDALDVDSVQVVAHDIGGGIALRLAIHTDRVDRLVLSNVTCYDSWPVEPIAKLGLPTAVRNHTYRDLVEALRETFGEKTHHERRATEEFVEGMIAPFSGPAREVTDLGRNAAATNTNHTLELVPHHDEISAPTLLLWGYPGSGQHVGYADRLYESIPDASREYLAESHHWVVQDRPDAYREGLAEFLD